MSLNSILRKLSERSAALVLKRPLAVILLVGVLALAAALAALRLDSDSGIESISGSSSATYQATQDWAEQFGGDPIVILVRGDLPKLALGPDLGVMLGLEGCLSGKIPASVRASAEVPRICKRLGDFKPAVAVYGPGTFVSTAARSVNEGIAKMLARANKRGEQAANAASELARRQGKTPLDQQDAARAAREVAKIEALNEALQLGNQYGLSVGNPPSIDNQAFVAQLIFDPQNGARTPKSRFQYLFPSSSSALIQVRLRPDLTQGQRAEAVDLVKRATALSKFQLDNGKYTVTGAPVVLAGAEQAVARAIVVALIGALIVMALVLLLVFPAELRLLPLALAVMAAAFTYGLLALTGSAIGVGAVAVLPVLVGLAVDYAIQFHARADRAMRDGAAAAEAVARAASGGGPPVLAAALATIAALLALALSPVPLIRGFGLLLVGGVLLAVVTVLTAGFATLGWAGGAASAKRRREPAETVARRLRLRQAFGAVTRRPSRALAIAAVLAVAGWTATLLSPVGADVRQLVPGGSQAVKDIGTLQKVTGSSGELDVLVRAKDVTDPTVIAWMRDYQSGVLAAAGYKGDNPRCEKARLCPALSLTDIFRGQDLTKQRVRQLLKSVGGDFSRGVVSPGRRMATMAFGVRLTSLSKQKDLVDMMRDRLNPPTGVRAEVVGVAALAADASGALSDPLRRALIAVVALALFFLVSLAVTGGRRRALPPLISVVAAAGISALLLFAARIDLNPMSAALGVFIIAIAGEFTLLIYLQYLRERAGDGAIGVETAFRRAYRAIGPALFASGSTAIAGFAVLALTDIGMLRGFALVAVVDLAVALLGTVLLLPAATIWVEGRAGRAKAGGDDARAERQTRGSSAAERDSEGRTESERASAAALAADE